MLREEATVLTGMLIGLSAIDFRWGRAVAVVGRPHSRTSTPPTLIPTHPRGSCSQLLPEG